MLPPKQCYQFLKALLTVLAELRVRMVVHQDLKPENFLVEKKSKVLEEVRVKMIDFGTARPQGPEDPMTTKVCTVHYCAPEILRTKMTPYSEKCSTGAPRGLGSAHPSVSEVLVALHLLTSRTGAGGVATAGTRSGSLRGPSPASFTANAR